MIIIKYVIIIIIIIIIISSHALVGMWLRIHAGIKVKPF